MRPDHRKRYRSAFLYSVLLRFVCVPNNRCARSWPWDETRTDPEEATDGQAGKPLDAWREELSDEQFRSAGSAPPSALHRQDATTRTPGVYHCVCCDAPLFDADAKFDSGCGWPSYFQPVSDTAIASLDDFSHGMHRIEVRCARCDAHLGHVFPMALNRPVCAIASIRPRST